MKKFGGLGVAMVTPFNSKGKIDFPALQRLTEHLIAGGADYLVVQGTTGESPTLSKDEKRSSLDFILEINNGKLPVVIGIGGNNTLEVARTIENFDFNGISGILSVSPSYNKPTQKGIIAHYKEICSKTDKPFILYNVPPRTGSNMMADTTLELAESIHNVVAIKEASGDLNQISQILANKPEGFDVISGDDGLTLPMLSLGAIGVISVIGNAFPTEFSDLVHKGLFGQMEDAQKVHMRLDNMHESLYKEGNPAGIKAVLKHIGICEAHVRLPLIDASEDLFNEIYHKLAQKDLVKI